MAFGDRTTGARASDLRRVRYFDTLSEVRQSGITDPEIDRLVVHRGGGVWDAAASEPGHTGKVKSADGRWWELVKDGRNNNLQFDAVGGATKTTEFQNALDFCAGGTLRILKDPAGAEYTTNTLTPAANTKIIIEPGVVINCVASGARVFTVNAQGVHIWGHGATLKSDGTQTSHVVAVLEDAEDCSIRGLKVIGAGSSGDDGIYIGGDPANNNVPRNISIIDCTVDGDAKARNCMSIVAGDGVLVQGGEYFGALNSPGSGIDVEANRFMANGTSAVRNIRIDGVKAHSNPNGSGISGIFCSEVTVENCECYSNGDHGLLFGGGGAQWNQGVARTGDVLGIKSFDTVGGWVEVTDGLAGNLLTDDLGIYEGMTAVRIGSTYPAEYALSRYTIAEIDSAQAKIRLGTSFGAGVIIPTTTGSGTFDFDPWTASMRLYVVGRAGNNDKIRLLNNRIWGNALEGIDVQTNRDVLIQGNDISSKRDGIKINYTAIASLYSNTLRQESGGAGGRGIQGGASLEQAITDGNYIEGFTQEGMSVSGSGGRYGRDEIVNCAATPGVAYRVQNAYTCTVSPILRTDAGHTITHGVKFEATCTNCLALGAIAKGVGSSNGNSLSGGTGTVWRDCVQMDGTFKP
jgi:hypothetical protein